MKNIIKNIVAALILSGLFFVPVLSSAQTSSDIVNDNNKLLNPSLYIDKSQVEIEAIEEMLILEAKSNLKPLYLNDPQKFNRRMFSSKSNEMNKDKSQAEVEAEEELLYIQAISVFRKLYAIDPIQANSKQSSLISNILVANYGEEIGLLQNLR